ASSLPTTQPALETRSRSTCTRAGTSSSGGRRLTGWRTGLAGIDWALVDELEGRYGAHAPTLHLLVDLPEKRVYRVDLDGQPAWVIRPYAPTSNRKTAIDLAAILSFQEQRSYPAERIVGATDGSELLTTADGWQVLVTTFIGGIATGFSASSLRRLGNAL